MADGRISTFDILRKGRRSGRVEFRSRKGAEAGGGTGRWALGRWTDADWQTDRDGDGGANK